MVKAENLPDLSDFLNELLFVSGGRTEIFVRRERLHFELTVIK